MAATIGADAVDSGDHSLRIFGAETQVTFGLALSIPREFALLITASSLPGGSMQLASRVGSMRSMGKLMP